MMKREIALTERQARLVEENLSLVWQVIAKHIKYNNTVCGLGLEDLFQEGACALCYAAESFQPDRGVPFSGYARPVIRNHLLDYCRSVQAQQQRVITIPFDRTLYTGQPPPALCLAESRDDVKDRLDRMELEQLLAYGKRTYRGVALQGIEAMELKLHGYTGAEIARIYRTTPNNVGAWITRAVNKLRNDFLAGQPQVGGKEKKAAGL